MGKSLEAFHQRKQSLELATFSKYKNLKGQNFMVAYQVNFLSDKEITTPCDKYTHCATSYHV